MISVQNLTKLYDDFPAVQDFNLDIAAGELVGLVGPNGAGKTTILRCLTGVIPPTEGTIRIAGYDLREQSVEAKKRLAFVPSEPHLFPYLTVTDHLSLYGRIYQVPDRDRRAPELLGQFGLEEKALAFPGELSRGMQQKLLICCALLHRPEVMILDEPLTGLDPRAMRQMRDTIAQAAEAGASVFLSSHLLTLVQALCRRIVILHKGRIVKDGSLADIRASLADAGGGDDDLEEVFLKVTEEPQPPAVP